MVHICTGPATSSPRPGQVTPMEAPLNSLEATGLLPRQSPLHALFHLTGWACRSPFLRGEGRAWIICRSDCVPGCPVSPSAQECLKQELVSSSWARFSDQQTGHQGELPRWTQTPAPLGFGPSPGCLTSSMSTFLSHNPRPVLAPCSLEVRLHGGRGAGRGIA